MKKLLIPLLFVFTSLAFVAGCSSKVEHISLQVQLVKLERKTNGTIIASLAFSNPNVGAVNIVKSTHQLTLDGRSAGVLEVAEPLGLPAQQTVNTTVTFTPAAGAAAVSGSVSYQLASLLTLSIYDDDVERYKTSSSGSVTVQ